MTGFDENANFRQFYKGEGGETGGSRTEVPEKKRLDC
jgi:hypothetical protein